MNIIWVFIIITPCLFVCLKFFNFFHYYLLICLFICLFDFLIIPDRGLFYFILLLLLKKFLIIPDRGLFYFIIIIKKFNSTHSA
jgi:hypothetical protein